MRPFGAQTEYAAQAFRGLSHPQEAIGQRAFYECTFEACSFLETAFESCKFFDCTFRECDLSLIKVKGSAFSNTAFADSKIIGVNWADARWTRFRIANAISFERCALDYSTFVGLSLKGIRLVQCSARDVDFAEADLTEADCSETDFADSRFLHTNLTRANFTGATNYAIDPGLNVLTQARFSLPEAIALLRGLDIVLTE